MYVGKRIPYLTETWSFPGTDQLFDSFKTNLLISSGQWVALVALHLVLCVYNDCSSPDWTAWSTFFAKLKWHDLALAKMVMSQWFCVLKEHLLATDTTKSIPVFFVLSLTLRRNVTSSSAIREAFLDTMKHFGRYSISITTEASENNTSTCLCLINNHSQYLSTNFKVDSVIIIGLQWFNQIKSSLVIWWTAFNSLAISGDNSRSPLTAKLLWAQCGYRGSWGEFYVPINGDFP